LASRAVGLVRLPIRRVILLAGIFSLVLPTLFAVARQHWSSEEGAHGPIILATGLWLFWRAKPRFASDALHGAASAALLLPLLLLYAFASAYDVLFVRTAALYLTLLLLGYLYLAPGELKRLWFPFIYAGFLVVPPGTLVTELTQPLKLWISTAAADLLYALGYPIARAGASIHIGPYELLVETACAGLGSLFTLSAISLLYVHLRWSAGIGHAVALMALIVPIAVFANFVRVITIVLLTYHFGDAVGQGFSHDLAGFFMFVVAVLAMFAADSLLQAIYRLRKPRS
jgi:exosortase